MPHMREIGRSLCVHTGIICVVVVIMLSLATPAFGQLSTEDIEALQQQAEAEGWTFTVGENSATHYSLDELCGTVEPENWRATAKFDPCTPNKTLPASFDWREITGCPPVRNQRSCGSCWAFSTVGALECAIRIKDGEDVDLSEQWLVSCNQSGWGCDGGWFAHDYHMSETDKCGGTGAVMEEHFPYSATDEPCNCPYPHKYTIEDWTFIGEPYGVPSNAAMKQAIMDHGPISIAFHVGSAFQAYTGGIFTACGVGAINHAVVLVGWDDTQGLEGVWLLRNSWGPNWGEDGYMRIKYNCEGFGTGANYIVYNRAQKIALVGDEIQDDIGGDGDGVPEAGESVRMVLSFENRFTTEATDVTATLFFDDAALTVTKPTAYLGNIPPDDTVTNAGSPFEFDIPADYIPRTDSLFVEFVWDGGAKVDTQVVERIIGGVPVLIVDDDNGDNLESYYTDYFNAMRLPYNLLDMSGSIQKTAENLSDYPMVIWFTGDYRSDPIDPLDIFMLTPYLDGGGKLFITGQGIASSLNNAAPSFLHDYLKAEYLSADYIPVLGDKIDGQVFIPDDSVVLIGSGGADNQVLYNQVAAVNGGVGELGFINNPGLGAISYDGDYRLLFFTFGFESIVNGSYRWTYRDTIFARIIDYFDLQKPGTSPHVDGLAVASGDPSHIIMPTPAFDWTYTDPASNPQAQYQAQVTDDKFWMMLPIWDTGPVAASDPEAVYDGSELMDGTDFYIRVRASNGLYWSDWAYADMHTNSVPTPVSLSPDNMETINGDHPELTHYTGDDLEDDSLTFTYELYDDSLMSHLLSVSGPDKAGAATWQVPMVLDGDEDYYWRVRASDGYEDGQWSELASFWVSSYIVGDANGDGEVNVGDAVFVINYVFKSGPAPDPVAAGDANCDGECNVGDAVYLISYVFKGGPAPGCK